METGAKKPLHRMKLLIPLILIVAAIAIFFYMKMNDDPSKSQVDGVSDEVYEQLVQWYFYTTIFMGEFMDAQEHESKVDTWWFEDHELYKEAEEYADAHEDVSRPVDVFPNPILLRYFQQPEDYNDTEQQYIESMYEFYKTFQRMNYKEYERLKGKVKEDLHIKDSYNPFD